MQKLFKLIEHLGQTLIQSSKEEKAEEVREEGEGEEERTDDPLI